MDEIKKMERRVNMLSNHIATQEQLKFWVGLYVMIFSFFLFYFMVYMGITDLTQELVPATTLEASLFTHFGYTTTQTGDVLTNIIPGKEFLFTSWDINNRTPRFFNWYSIQNW
jgi:hypothetical protein